MKLRYYLRGLGIGIIVTALIMGMISEAGKPLTDAEIRALAANLGMVDSGSLRLADVGGSVANQSGSSSGESDGAGGGFSGKDEFDPAGEPTADDGGDEGPAGGSPKGSGAGTESDISVSGNAAPASSLGISGTEGETVTIVVVEGDGSYTVSRRLEEAGLIEDAREFDNYLIENGYSKTIRTGTYRIPLGATWEEIVDIIA